MSIPERIKNPQLPDYLHVMSRAVFQTGLRWSSIEAKWPDFMDAYDGFDPHKVAAYSSEDMQRLSSDSALLRSPSKVKATVQNAQTILKLDAEFSGFANYLRSFKDYDALARDFKKRFKFMGDMNVYYFLFRVCEPVPDFESWIKTIPGEHPRMREMVELGREQDRRQGAG